MYPPPRNVARGVALFNICTAVSNADNSVGAEPLFFAPIILSATVESVGSVTPMIP